MQNILFNIIPLSGSDNIQFMCVDPGTTLQELLHITARTGQTLFASTIGGLQSYCCVPIFEAQSSIISAVHDYAELSYKMGSLYALVESLLSVGCELYQKKRFCFEQIVPGHKIIIGQGKPSCIGSVDDITAQLVQQMLQTDRVVSRLYQELEEIVLDTHEFTVFISTFIEYGEKFVERIAIATAKEANHLLAN